jgi:hypothetical protein
VSRVEIETEWSINDVWDANTVLDLIEISEDDAMVESDSAGRR